jgi:hypothetical protein
VHALTGKSSTATGLHITRDACGRSAVAVDLISYALRLEVWPRLRSSIYKWTTPVAACSPQGGVTHATSQSSLQVCILSTGAAHVDCRAGDRSARRTSLNAGRAQRMTTSVAAVRH